MVLQLRSVYLPIPLPYVPYVDNTAHAASVHWPPSAPWRKSQFRKVLAYERAFFGGAMHIFATGELVAASLSDVYGVPAHRITVVGAGCQYKAVPPPSHRRRPCILFVGYDFNRKGGDRLISAFRAVRRRCPEAELKIVGPRLRLSELGVEVLGPIHDPKRLAALYSKALVFALPVRYEPYGISFLEAMAHGVACVGTSEGAIPEIIQHGVTGYVIPSQRLEELERVLVHLLLAPEHAAALGEAGRRRVVDRLNWDTVAARMAGVLTHERGGGSPPS